MESSVIIMVLLVLAIAAHLRINSLQDRLNSLDPEYQKEQRALAKQADRQMRAAGVVAAKSAPTPRVARKKQEKNKRIFEMDQHRLGDEVRRIHATSGFRLAHHVCLHE